MVGQCQQNPGGLPRPVRPPLLPGGHMSGPGHVHLTDEARTHSVEELPGAKVGHVRMPAQKGMVPVGHWHSSLSCLNRYGPKRLPPPKQAQLQQASPHVRLSMRPHVKNAKRQVQTSKTTAFENSHDSRGFQRHITQRNVQESSPNKT